MKTLIAFLTFTVILTMPKANAGEVTWSDLSDLREKVFSQVSQVKSDTGSRINDMREDIRQLRAELRELKAELEKLRRQIKDVPIETSSRFDVRTG